MPKKTAPFQFEQSLAELQSLVDKFESNKLTLEESLTHFEKGIQLTRQCQQALQQAEQKIQILLEESGEYRLEPHESDE